MRPQSDGITHTLRFVNIDEGAFVGGGMDPIPSDVGLWVMKAGKLEAKGARKVPWIRAEAVPAGATELHLSSAPTGWRKGDEVAITPTLPPTDPASTTSEVARIQAVRRSHGRARLGHLLRPSLCFGPSWGVRAGDPECDPKRADRGYLRRAFSHIPSPERPQTISNVAVRYMGPRKDGRSVLGRYGVHFHMAEDGTRGSTLTGVVVRDCNSHAFVPHFSFGITFRECISFNTVSAAYWWDRRVLEPVRVEQHSSDYPYTSSKDIVYERCVAADVRGLNPDESYRLSGFSLNRGTGHKATGCVATGIQGGIETSGFMWPENNHGKWSFEDCVSHNNAQLGLFIWQNSDGTQLSSLIQRCSAYHNMTGIHHGAYRSFYLFEDCWCYGNTRAGVLLAAQSTLTDSSRYIAVHARRGRARGSCPAGRSSQFHGGQPTNFEDCRFLGARIACVGVTENQKKYDSEFFIDCTYEGNEFWLADKLSPKTILEVTDAVHGHVYLRPKNQPGTYVPEWNASVTQAETGE